MRTKVVLWLLLLAQACPLLVVLASGAGFFDPLGVLIEQIALSTAGQPPTFLVNATRFVTLWWFFACAWLINLGMVAAIIYVSFDRSLTRLERLVWAVGFFLGHSITVILYCLLKLLGTRARRQQAVA